MVSADYTCTRETADIYVALCSLHNFYRTIATYPLSLALWLCARIVVHYGWPVVSVACFETPPLLDGSVSKHAAGFRNPHLSILIGSS